MKLKNSFNCECNHLFMYNFKMTITKYERIKLLKNK